MRAEVVPTPREATLSLALELLDREGGVWVEEASPSMQPLIRPGDALRLVPLDRARVARGGLVAYHRGAALVVHRVLVADADGVVAKGDALASADARVPWAAVVARVAALRRADGRVVDLDAFPRPLVARALGWIARVAASLALETGGERRPLRRLFWKALRLPFHLTVVVLR